MTYFEEAEVTTGLGSKETMVEQFKLRGHGLNTGNTLQWLDCKDFFCLVIQEVYIFSESCV